MTIASVTLASADSDDGVDVEIEACLNPAAPRSFFVYAGAGSGKTRSLKHALETFRERYGADFRRSGARIAVITYTRAAAMEIAERVGEDPLFPISTIHSFCWSLIGGHHNDIRSWLRATLPEDLAELERKQAKGRPSQASRDRERAMASIRKRLDLLSTPRVFTYNPNGDNFGADSLSHAEVIAITANFILEKAAMQAVLTNAFPFIMIDESQDTTKGLISALFSLAEKNRGRFALGLLGDSMQRIYGDGQADLGRQIPEGWANPVKRMNHRSGRRIVQLGNAIRADVDGQEQWARDDSTEGVVRLFVAPADAADKPAIEQRIQALMAKACADEGWMGPNSQVKTLTLEHHMAASRRGFASMFAALDADKRLSPGLKRGDLAGLRFFSEQVAPLIAAIDADDRFAVMSLLRASSPLLQAKALAECDDALDPLRAAREAVESLARLRPGVADPSFQEVLRCVAQSGLFDIPQSLAPFVSEDGGVGAEQAKASEEGDLDVGDASAAAGLAAWRQFLGLPYREIIPFAEHVADRGPYGTHQGVKGLEFDRVLVIMDDDEAKGFLFSYEKLFGTKPLSDGDLKHLKAQEETGADRTRRLLYVTVTRARSSLALVGYTADPVALSKLAVEKGWFVPDEVIRLNERGEPIDVPV